MSSELQMRCFFFSNNAKGLVFFIFASPILISFCGRPHLGGWGEGICLLYLAANVMQPLIAVAYPGISIHYNLSI